LNGRRHGQGKYTYKSGRIHEGSYVNGKRQGKGKLIDERGVCEGMFEDGKINGRGKFQFHNGDLYEGDFK
jgi:hypothetical protein